MSEKKSKYLFKLIQEYETERTKEEVKLFKEFFVNDELFTSGKRKLAIYDNENLYILIFADEERTKWYALELEPRTDYIITRMHFSDDETKEIFKKSNDTTANTSRNLTELYFYVEEFIGRVDLTLSLDY